MLWVHINRMDAAKSSWKRLSLNFKGCPASLESSFDWLMSRLEYRGRDPKECFLPMM